MYPHKRVSIGNSITNFSAKYDPDPDALEVSLDQIIYFSVFKFKCSGRNQLGCSWNITQN
jgi:hypothetical protein